MATRTANVPRIHGLDSFRAYMADECDKHFPEDSSLADYIHKWLWDGDGVEYCSGDFEIFLKTIPLIVDEWYRDPAILHFAGSDIPKAEPFERYATSAFGGDNELHSIFDRDNFTTATFSWRHSFGRDR